MPSRHQFGFVFMYFALMTSRSSRGGISGSIPFRRRSFLMFVCKDKGDRSVIKSHFSSKATELVANIGIRFKLSEFSEYIGINAKISKSTKNPLIRRHRKSTFRIITRVSPQIGSPMFENALNVVKNVQSLSARIYVP